MASHFENGRPVAIVNGARIPFCRAGTAYADTGNLDMMTAALKFLVQRNGLDGSRLGEVALGAVMKHSRDWNLAREAALGSGLDPHTPAYDVQRACGTSLETALQVARRIALGEIGAGIAGGVDSISDIPIVHADGFARIARRAQAGKTAWARIKPWFGLRPRHLVPQAPGVVEPRTGLSMGEHCELMAKDWHIARADQDALALTSHHRAAAAWRDGFYAGMVFPWHGAERDNNVRADTSPERLAALKPVFDRSGTGTLTAGNSTPLTDGAAAVLLADADWARARGLEAEAFITHGESAAVDFVNGGEGLLMAPAYAVPRMLARAGLTLQDFDFYEIHEAFAAQVLCTLNAWESASFCRDRLGLDAPLGEVDRDKLNVRGGSVALGHPFGATGARVLMTASRLLAEKGGGRALVSVCTGGGMGVTAIIEK